VRREASARSVRRGRWGLVGTPPKWSLAAGAVIGSIVIIAGTLVYQARQGALEHARSTAGNLSSLLHEQTLSAFKSTDLALQIVRGRLEGEEIAENDSQFRTYLRMRLRNRTSTEKA